MRLESLQFYRVRIRLKRPVRHASHERTETESLIVAARLASGLIGWGEGLPRPYVTGETMDDVWELVRTLPWTRLLPCEPSGAAEIAAMVAALPIADPTHEQRGCFGNSLRAAVELALADAAARAAGQPLWQWLQPVARAVQVANEQPPLRLHYSGAITGLSPYSQRMRSFKIWLWRFRTAKVKVGAAGIDDRDLLRRVRRWLPAPYDLRADANEAWLPNTLDARLEMLRGFGISSIEQPTPHAMWKDLRGRRGTCAVPIMLDESVCSPRDLQRASDEGLCDLVNLRLSKCGGPLATVALAGQAARAGLGWQLGCQVGETGILSAAGRHVATALKEVHWLEGSFDRHLVRERLTREDVTFRYGGWAPRLDGPGLGVTLDEAALARATMQQVGVAW